LLPLLVVFLDGFEMMWIGLESNATAPPETDADAEVTMSSETEEVADADEPVCWAPLFSLKRR